MNKFDEQTSLKTVLRYFAKVPFFRTRFVVFPIENQANGLTYLTHPQMNYKFVLKNFVNEFNLK